VDLILKVEARGERFLAIRESGLLLLARLNAGDYRHLLSTMMEATLFLQILTLMISWSEVIVIDLWGGRSH
jgi:hypothetical protein